MMSRRHGKRCAVVLWGSAILAAAFSPAWAATDEPLFRSVILLDNEEVQVVENRYEPGSVAPLHSHQFPRRVVYVESGGTLEITPGRKRPDGSLEHHPIKFHRF